MYSKFMNLEQKPSNHQYIWDFPCFSLFFVPYFVDASSVLRETSPGLSKGWDYSLDCLLTTNLLFAISSCHEVARKGKRRVEKKIGVKMFRIVVSSMS